MLRLFLGYIRDYALTRHSPNESMADQNGSSLPIALDCPIGAMVTPSNCGIARDNGESTDGESDDDDIDSNSDSNSDSQSDGVSSRHIDSPGHLDESEGSLKRRRWSESEDLRQRAYVGEGKEWPWIAKRLRRSEPAVTQHWRIISQAGNQREEGEEEE
jgi:hypothetical protein